MFVLGGGNTSMDASIECARMGVEVVLAYRRSIEKIEAYHFEYHLAKAVGVKAMFNFSHEEIIGENGKVKSIKLIRHWQLTNKKNK